VPDYAAKRLINNLDHMYHAETGKIAPERVSRYNDNYGRAPEKHGKPIGPFFRIVRAVFQLLGEQRTDEAIATAIEHRKNMGKTGSY
jgi:hypothetical protein